MPLDAKANRMTVSRIFLWFYLDFGTERLGVLPIIASHLPSPEKEVALSVTAIDYFAYDWGINSITKEDP